MQRGPSHFYDREYYGNGSDAKRLRAIPSGPRAALPHTPPPSLHKPSWWTLDRDQLLLDLFHGGRSQTQIAERFSELFKTRVSASKIAGRLAVIRKAARRELRPRSGREAV